MDSAKRKCQIKWKKAFTLIELSIVMAIIGLIVSGIVSGKNLVRNAQLRSIISDYQMLDIAVSSFKGNYGQLPGDFDDAYAIWGSNCSSAASSCNGNNDWIIRIDGGPSTRQEGYMSFKHLNLAGLIPGAYTGSSSLSNSESTPGVNSMAGKLPDSEWMVANTYIGGLYDNNAIHLGRHHSWQSSFNEVVLLTPGEANSIDAKMDDGKPQIGLVHGATGILVGSTAGTYASNCYTGTSAAATYVFSALTVECVIQFRMTASPLKF